MVLHRLDRAWQTRHRRLGVLVRYCDDLVILCPTKERADAALAALTAVLDELGLRLAAAKTHVVDLRQGGTGFDFLGWVWLLCRDCLTWEVGDLVGWVATLPRGCRGGMQRWASCWATAGGGTRQHGCGWDGLRAKSGPIQPQGSQRPRCLYWLSCV